MSCKLRKLASRGFRFYMLLYVSIRISSGGLDAGQTKSSFGVCQRSRYVAVQRFLLPPFSNQIANLVAFVKGSAVTFLWQLIGDNHH